VRIETVTLAVFFLCFSIAIISCMIKIKQLEKKLDRYINHITKENIK